MSDVSIVIVCHDKERWVEQAVWSAMNQVCDVKYEVVVHHDGCGGPGSGANAARNAAMRAVNSPWSLLLDADDMLPSHYLAELWRVKRHVGRERLLIGAPVQFIEGCRLDMLKRPKWPDAFGVQRYYEQDFLKGNPTMPSNLFPTHAWRDLGGWDENLRAMTDGDLWLRMMQTGYECWVTTHTFLLRRDVPGSITNSVPRQPALDYFNAKFGTKFTDPRMPYVVPSREECSIEGRILDGVVLREV